MKRRYAGEAVAEKTALEKIRAANGTATANGTHSQPRHCSASSPTTTATTRKTDQNTATTATAKTSTLNQALNCPKDWETLSLVPANYDQSPWLQEAGPTVFAPFPDNSDYFGDPQKVWMINFRVRNLDTVVAQLRAAGVAVKLDPQPYPNGRFARLCDPEGNPIELWEPQGRDATRATLA